ncbi:MAG: hypothetical protein COB83_13615 [Gammaproteobacteria bacterium]|nr:MAG: hypothetical protein COB83_13615 [Gammaproteobacteria bacterium]
MKRTTLSIKKQDSENPLIEVTNKGEEVVIKNTNKASGKATTKTKPVLSNLFQIIEDIFKPKEQGNEAKAKLLTAKVNADHEKALVGLPLTEKLNNEQVEKLVAYVGKTDREFKALLHFAVLSNECRNNLPQQLILDFCAKAVSKNWILKHKEEINIYKSLPQNISFGNQGYMSHLTMLINAKYDKRITSVKEAEKKLKEIEVNSDKKKNKDTNDKNNGKEFSQKTTNNLNTERVNVIAIGYLWGLVTGKSDSDSILSCVYKLLKNEKEFNTSDKSIVFNLVGTLDTKSRYTTANIIEYFTKKSELDKQQGASAKSELISVKNKVDKLVSELSERDIKVKDLEAEITRLKSDVDVYRHQIQENELDEKAKRFHLKDDTGKAKSKAFNLLNEDTLTPLKLCLSALDREKPITEVAIHHIELIIENLESELPWFIK